VKPGLVLVHGYTGSPEDLAPLAAALGERYGTDGTDLVRLAGHGSGRVPDFRETSFVASVQDAVSRFRDQGRRIILLGHSTGGSITLAALSRSGIRPDLLILASVPHRIDAAYFERWSVHRRSGADPSFTSVAEMISLINRAAAARYDGPFPVLVLQGSRDELVPSEAAGAWRTGNFAGPVRTTFIPGAGHDLFRGEGGAPAVDVVVRAVRDVLHVLSAEERGTLERIKAAEPEAARFLSASPLSAVHLAASASGRSAAGLLPSLQPVLPAEPVIANIEITTRCNLRCSYCARTQRGGSGGDMPFSTFKTVLGLLPHAYRITLVGLGETLLHPQVADCVAEASSQGRRTALVTNAMLLDEALSRKLLKAGLESIAFSIDGATQETASRVRPGTDLGRVTENIKRFVQVMGQEREISTAVFSAVSTDTVDSLDGLIELVSGLGVHVLMLSDLNFPENAGKTLWKHADQATSDKVRSAVASAFKKNLPVLSLRGLEEFGLWERYGRYLLLPPDRLYQRSLRRSWCCSPWQTLPINVNGEVTLCDCQPGATAGNVLVQPLSAIWNGTAFVEHRRKMLSDDPPAACVLCPRF
jgi:MoaA/NifB/PqqE/SkfB family radical SAM enzyme/alpha-beta hydrolase superfamily lysophospholipase